MRCFVEGHFGASVTGRTSQDGRPTTSTPPGARLVYAAGEEAP